MIAPFVIREIQRLLRQGRFSQRQIARKLRISRGTVNAVAQGKRTEDSVHKTGCEEKSEGIVFPTGAPTRCPECGKLVQKPCLACQLRKLRKKMP